MSYQTLLNSMARVVGGTQPNAAQVAAGSATLPALQPYWFSGLDTGDGSGVAGLAGCFSLPTETIGTTPIALVLPSSWLPLQPFPTQGKKYREDTVHVRVLTGHGDLQTEMAQLVLFADLVPTAFDTHMQLFGEPYVVTADCSEGSFLEIEWPAGTVYTCVEFVVKVQRAIPITYVG